MGRNTNHFQICRWVFLGSFFSGCAVKKEFVHQDSIREYILYRPPNLPPNAPLVFMMHGYHGTARLYSIITGLNKVSRENGFAVVYPQGTRNKENITYWNAQLNFEDVDDVGFLTELAISLQKEYDFDPNRTYATGFSNGGFMSYTLGCQHPEIFSGVVSMMGTMSGETWNSCTPSLPIPVLQMTGTLDSTVPMDGSMTLENGWGGAPHIYEIMEFWAEHNECQDKKENAFTHNTTSIVYSQCLSGSEVWYYEVEGLGHTLPNTKHDEWDAMQELWIFVQRQSEKDETSTGE